MIHRQQETLKTVLNHGTNTTETMMTMTNHTQLYFRLLPSGGTQAYTILVVWTTCKNAALFKAALATGIILVNHCSFFFHLKKAVKTFVTSFAA